MLSNLRVCENNKHFGMTAYEHGDDDASATSDRGQNLRGSLSTGWENPTPILAGENI